MVDNVQYVHDNRAINYLAGPFSSTGLITTVGRDTYSNNSMYFYYRGSDVDDADLDGAFFWAQIATSNGAANACAVLWDVNAGGSVIGSSASTVGTDPNLGTPSISGDISACLPTGNVSVQTRFKANGACLVKYQSSGLLLVF